MILIFLHHIFSSGTGLESKFARIQILFLIRCKLIFRIIPKKYKLRNIKIILLVSCGFVLRWRLASSFGSISSCGGYFVFCSWFSSVRDSVRILFVFSSLFCSWFFVLFWLGIIPKGIIRLRLKLISSFCRGIIPKGIIRLKLILELRFRLGFRFC